MTSTFKRIVIAAIALIVVAGVAVALVVSGGCSSTVESPIDGARNGAVNALLDSSGIKDRIDYELHERAGEIAQTVGVSESVVNNVVDSLDVKGWQATTLPSDAVETGTYSVEVDGTPAQITTYDDPSIVTINAYGQSVTMELPESAQDYVSLLNYLDYLQ